MMNISCIRGSPGLGYGLSTQMAVETDTLIVNMLVKTTRRERTVANSKMYPYLKKFIDFKHLEGKTNTTIGNILLMGHLFIMYAKSPLWNSAGRNDLDLYYEGNKM